MANPDIAVEIIPANTERVGTVTYMVGGRLTEVNRNFLVNGSDNQPGVAVPFANYDDMLDEVDYYTT
jgi:hypothetical protein